MMILVTGATGMFGARVVRGLLDAGEPVRALVRERSRGGDLETAGAELTVGDMDRPETLPGALQGVQRVFLLSPMDDRIDTRESAVKAAAEVAGVELVIELYGAVKHREDSLDRLHLGSFAALRDSGLRWALLSPNSVMETSLLAQAESIKQTGAMWGCAGDGKVGLIAADDPAAAGMALLIGEPEPEPSYEVTGPEAVNMAYVAQRLSAVLGREIVYNDMPEDVFRDVLAQQWRVTIPAADEAWTRQAGGNSLVNSIGSVGSGSSKTRRPACRSHGLRQARL